MIGPVIGGVLDEAFGWQANFALLLGLGGVGLLALVWADLGETPPCARVSFADQMRSYPGLLRSRGSGATACAAAFASGASSPISAARPMSATEVFGLDPGHARLAISARRRSATWRATSWRGGFRCGSAMNRMVLIGRAGHDRAGWRCWRC